VKKFNFKDFLLQEKQLDRVIRFSAHTRIKDESVAEHSFHMSLYAMILADLEEKFFKNKVDKEKLLKSALLHDLEECRTGDIIYGFKHTDKALTRKIKKISREFLEDLMKNLPEKISKEYINLWQTAKNKNSLEGKILDAADKLEGLIYALNELSLGNKGFKSAIDTYEKQLKAINLKSVNLILKQIL
jgi:putative hydrolase of HD superfamily